MARQQRQQDKMARRLASKDTPAGGRPDDIDPDIAGIVPGPQPRGEEWHLDEAPEEVKPEEH